MSNSKVLPGVAEVIRGEYVSLVQDRSDGLNQDHPRCCFHLMKTSIGVRMEPFAMIRRDARVGGLSIRGLAKRLSVVLVKRVPCLES